MRPERLWRVLSSFGLLVAPLSGGKLEVWVGGCAAPGRGEPLFGGENVGDALAPADQAGARLRNKRSILRQISKKKEENLEGSGWELFLLLNLLWRAEADMLNSQTHRANISSEDRRKFGRVDT